MTVTIYHNPKCGTSRNVLEILREAAGEPVIVEYLKTGWTRPQLQSLLKRMGAKPRDILRARESAAEELLAADASDAAILDAMVANPILVNRPIVTTPKGAALCRPPETVRALL
jgi:arsenate reductase